MDTREFNRLMKYSHLNDDESGVLQTVYNSELPHPYFDPKNITLNQLRFYKHDRWGERKNNIMIWQDIEYLDPIECPVGIQPQDRVVCGSIYYNTSWPCPSAFSSWHFHKVVVVNRELELAQPKYKPFFADVLLGGVRGKPMRKIFFNLLKENNLLEKNIINYFNNYKSSFLEKGTDRIDVWFKDKDDPYTPTEIDGHFASQYISKHIYENSWVSVVAESQHSNDFFFPTEKTGKALFGKRPFIVLSGQHYLRTLRSLGFRTFDSVIDESYDEIEDYTERTHAAFRSFTDLMLLDQQQVRQQLYDVLEHNHQLICNKDELNKDVQALLGNLITHV
jgi:hypothetical protein